MIRVPSTRRLIAAVVTAAATALAAHVATLFVYFVGNGFDSSLFGLANSFFGLSSLLVFVFLAVGIFFTDLARWYLAVLVGVLAAALGIFVGTLLAAALGGTPVNGDLLGGVIASFGGVNLPLLIAVLLTTVSLAPAVYASLLGSRPAKLRAGSVALVRLPARNLADGVVTHLERSAVDSDLADDQWAGYVDALRDAGWTIVEVPLADELADSVFVEDVLLVIDDVAVVTRPGSEHRLAELEDIDGVVQGLGMSLARITEPATLDGGDVLQIGSTVYVGVGGRTNEEGVRQLRALLRGLGRTVVAVPVTGALHLKSAVTALPDGTVLGHGNHVDPRLFPHYLEVPEPSGAHVISLSDDRVLMAASAPASAALIESLGYEVVRVDISEFEKLEGCVTCLSVRIP